MVEPWLGPWARLREEYAKYQRGESTVEQGAEALGLGSHGGAREGAGRPPTRDESAAAAHAERRSEREIQGSERNLEKTVGRGRGYALARLDRDHPKLAARVRAGELSANAAAIEAGFRKPRDPLADAKAAWRRMSPEQRAAFEDWIARERRKEAA
jgi:hypothetical protein